MVDGKDGQWIYFDMVPEEYEVRTGTPQITGKICVIGSKMAEDKIAEIFGVKSNDEERCSRIFNYRIFREW